MALSLRHFLLLWLVPACVAYFTLERQSFTQLPTSIRNNAPLYSGMDLGTATDGAYDPVNKVMYIIGTTSHLMHVIDVIDPKNPVTLLTHTFPAGQGTPSAVDVCGNHVAVSLFGIMDKNEGHVLYFLTYVRGSGATQMVTDRYLTVGMHPEHLKYSRDCSYLVVSNEGEPGRDILNTYHNPEGTITIIHEERQGSPTIRTADFSEFNQGGPKFNPNIRVPSVHIPSAVSSNAINSIAEDFEPECVTISNDARIAWVTLQENDAIAEISLSTGLVTKVTPLPRKDWSDVPIDTSDRDGGVHRNIYPGLKSIRMPGTVKQFQIGNKRYLFTADEGAETVYTANNHDFSWTDAVTAKSLAGKISASQTGLKTNASSDELLGRLHVSSVDGLDVFKPEYTHLEFFGGRGFSIWDSGNMNLIFDSQGTLEDYMENYKKEVFNTNYVKSSGSYESPETMRDSVSHLQGAKVTGLDVAEDNGTVFLVVGTSSTGTLFLYHVDTSSGVPVPLFQSILRTGDSTFPWNHLYTDKTTGDLFISDLGIIKGVDSPTGVPLVYVVSDGAGSLSLYEIQDQSLNIP